MLNFVITPGDVITALAFAGLFGLWILIEAFGQKNKAP